MYFRSFTYERFIKPVSMNGTIIKSISYSIKSIRDLIVRLRRNEFSGLSVYLIRTENEKQFESYRDTNSNYSAQTKRVLSLDEIRLSLFGIIF